MDQDSRNVQHGRRAGERGGTQGQVVPRVRAGAQPTQPVQQRRRIQGELSNRDAGLMRVGGCNPT